MVNVIFSPDSKIAANGFAAMGSDARLEVLGTLVKAGPQGLTVSEIQHRTHIKGSTLAHHLRILVSAGLATQERQGRAVFTRAAFEHLQALAGYILKECCVDAQQALDQRVSDHE